MSQDVGEIAQALKQARQAKGLSQRALSQRAGVPQGHISNIERGTVDLRLSSLVAIARVLDLELALVPRKSLPAVQAVARSLADRLSTGAATYALERALSEPARPAYSLDDEDDDA